MLLGNKSTRPFGSGANGRELARARKQQLPGQPATTHGLSRHSVASGGLLHEQPLPSLAEPHWPRDVVETRHRPRTEDSGRPSQLRREEGGLVPRGTNRGLKASIVGSKMRRARKKGGEREEHRQNNPTS